MVRTLNNDAVFISYFSSYNLGGLANFYTMILPYCVDNPFIKEYVESYLTNTVYQVASAFSYSTKLHNTNHSLLHSYY